MRVSSAKAKGKRAVTESKDLILKYYPDLQPDDLQIMPTSVPGEDLKLSPLAQQVFPFSCEMKNTEKIQIWAAIEQAETNANGRIPLVIFRRNRSKLMVCLEFEEFLKLTTKSVNKLDTDDKID